ncbi:hypothetical protein QUV93_01535 [Phascolarctobacterium faecium]|nr:hypothetical protein [Phascolarctobacterium faecium]MDM8108550.1 hypothetical protein [Phascolarctobacterium faecium]
MEDTNNEELREMQKDIKNMMSQISVIQAMLSNGILKTQEKQDRRLDKHSDRLDALEKTQHQALTLKSLLVWMTATILTAIGIVVAVAQIILK